MVNKNLEEHRKDVAYIDKFLRLMNQSYLNPTLPTSICGWIWQVWPLWYINIWIVIYIYLIFAESKSGGISLISEQMWCMISNLQCVAKLMNGLFQRTKLHDLFKWCEECYTMDYRREYVSIVDEVYQKRSRKTRISIRIITSLVVASVIFYTIQPIILRVHQTPTRIFINGNDDWPDYMFVLIFFCQGIYAFAVGCGIPAYDGIFILFTVSLSNLFRVMAKLLSLLTYRGPRDHQRDRRILVDMYKMHLGVLDATALFRSYYWLYGLLQLGTNILVNCTLIFNLQTLGLDYTGICVLASSCLQVLFISVIGQLLQDEASDFGDALYDTNWLAMSPENKELLLLLMIGSNRAVHIRAGGIAELNLGLFVQVMKAGISLCAVMKAI